MKNIFKKVITNMAVTMLTMIGFMLLFMCFLILISVVSDDERVEIRDHSVLVIDLAMNISDSPQDISAYEYLEDSMSGAVVKTIHLKALIDGIDRAADDERIASIYMHGSLTPYRYGSNFAALREVREALNRFKSSGKLVNAYLVDPELRDYYLASAADQVMLNPYGNIVLKGLAANFLYFGDAFKKYGIGVQASKVGKYKSAVEMFTQNKMSPEAREQTEALLELIWSELISGISLSRKIDSDKLFEISEQHVIMTAEEALEFGLVDEVGYIDEMLDKLSGQAGYDEELESFTQVGISDYIALDDEDVWGVVAQMGSDKIAVIYAEGDIVMGEGDRDQVGCDRLARELRRLRHDDTIKAVVMRVNSPGGSALASEVIEREVILMREAKPVVVSMGAYAASGGYWISSRADAIIAEPMSITGSIGVFGLYFNIQDIAKEYGVNFDSVKTSPYADIFSAMKPRNDQEMVMLQRLIDMIYDSFIERVAEGRKLTPEQVHEIAQGRVWSGVDALNVGLVDKLGGIQDAIGYAAELAGISDETAIVEIPRRRRPLEFLLEMFKDDAQKPPVSRMSPLAHKLNQLKRELPWLRCFTDNRGTYTRLPFNLLIE